MGKSAKPKPRKQSVTSLRKKADKLYSQYVRLRDSKYIKTRDEWVGNCISCDKKLVVMSNGKWLKTANNGHFVGRGNYELRYDDENCNLQCPHCNAWRDKISMLEAYERALDDKYGTGTAKRLKKRPVRSTMAKTEFQQVIKDSTEAITFLLAN